jgi:hypothetical protein
VRKLLISLLLCGPVAAQPIQVVALEWNQLQGREGDRLSGRVTLSAPAPAGGVTLIFEPALKLSIPITVRVPGGQTSAEFPVKIVDNRFFDRGAVNTVVTVCLSGQEYDFPGPIVSDD